MKGYFRIMTDKPVIETKTVKRLKITVVRVFKASFNDTYWLEDFYVDLDSLDKEKLTWFDPYNKKGLKNTTRVAVSYCSDEKIIILVESDGEVKEQTSERGIDCIVSEDYDENTFIAAHISMQ